jgi:hypothetical protein
MAVRVPWTQVQHSVGRVRAGVRRAQLCCVRGDARRRNLLDLKVWTLTLPRGQPTVPALLSIYPSSRRSVLSSYGYTCDIFPFKSINTTYVSIDTWSTSYTSGFFLLPTHTFCQSTIYECTIHTLLSMWYLRPTPSLSRAPRRSSNRVISRFYFPWLLQVLRCYLCLVVSLFPSFPLFFFFPFLFHSLVYSVSIGTMV